MSAFALLGAAVCLGALWVLIALLAQEANPLKWAYSSDGRLSTSKLQLLLWTAVVAYGYLAVLLTRFWLKESTVIPDEVSINVLVALGFSATAAVGAKTITVSQLDKGQIAKKPSSLDSSAHGLYGAFQADDGSPDLGKIQVMIWTFIALGVYLYRVWIQTHTSAPRLPDIEPALMVLSGLSQGAYLGTKLIVSGAPVIHKLDPLLAAIGSSVKITGSNFGDGSDGMLHLNQLPVDFIDWAGTAIDFTVPASLPDGTNIAGSTLQVTVAVRGQTSQPWPLTIKSQTPPGGQPLPPSPPPPPPPRAPVGQPRPGMVAQPPAAGPAAASSAADPTPPAGGGPAVAASAAGRTPSAGGGSAGAVDTPEAAVGGIPTAAGSPRWQTKSADGSGAVLADSNATATANFADRGGLVLPAVNVHLVFWGAAWLSDSAPTVDAVAVAFGRVLSGPYMGSLEQYRGIGAGSLVGETAAADSDPPPQFTNDAVSNLLTQLFEQNRLPEPDTQDQLLYCVVMPPGASASDPNVIGEHSYYYYWDFELPFDIDMANKVYYAWVLNDGTIDGLSTIFSHELVEAVTDPEGSAILGDAASCHGGGWCEIGDVCQGNTGESNGVTVQAYWSQNDVACVIPT